MERVLKEENDRFIHIEVMGLSEIIARLDMRRRVDLIKFRGFP